MSTLQELPSIMERAKTEYEALEKGSESFSPGTIACGDNALFMARFCKAPEKQLDFIYVDPPFFSGADYKARITRDGKVERPIAYSDRWDSLADFLQSLALRLFLMKDLLKDSGSIAVHLDPRASHYAKVMMDDIFGSSNFVNELIWSYKSGGASERSFARKHDTILLYSRSKNYYFCPQKERSYNRGGKPYRFRGVEEFQDSEGRWYTLVNRKDVLSVDMVGRTSAERTGYASQKPEKLLEILISSCCPEGGLCADFFCGSGSLGAAASKLGRAYVLCDRSPLAIDICKERLKQQIPR